MKTEAKLILAILATSLLAGCADRAPSEAEVIEEIQQLKVNDWPEIYATKDGERLDEFLANDFVLIAGGAVSPKNDEVAWLKNPGDWQQPADFSYEVEDVILIADDAAIVFGQGRSTRTNEAGLPCAHTYWSSNTLRRVNGTWKPVTSHVSDAKCEPL